MSEKPRIFIGVPCYGKTDPEVTEDWFRFAYHLGRRMPEYDFFLGIKTKSEQFRARNAIVEAARQMNADWLLMLDDDMIINPLVTAGPAEEYGFIGKLIAHNKDICGALYYQRGGACLPVLMQKVSEKGYRFLRDDEITHGLQRVDVAGGGCLLIRMSLFDKLPYPYFGPEYQWGTDIQLCSSATEHGFEVWADTSIELGHLKNEKVIVTSRNKNKFALEDGTPGEIKRTFVNSETYERLIRDACEWTGRPDLEALCREADSFVDLRKDMDVNDAEWYRLFPKQRVCRQVWFNTERQHKREMTDFVINSVNHSRPSKILDFGCGIGIPAFEFAERGHQVTALDIRGTGTFEFLKWRSQKHGTAIRFIESEGGAPLDLLGEEQFDVIVAMDSIEHIEKWRDTVAELGRHLRPGGVLFSNNGILDDKLHPEHYDVDNKEFIAACMESGMMPFNQITYVKKEEAVYA